MKRYYLLFLILIISLKVQAQVKISGIIADSTNTPFILSNVIAKDPATKDIITYSITNSEGYYEMELVPNKSYELEVSYVGMKTEIIKVNDLKADQNINVVLIPDQSLEQIELVYKMPISIRGDTISYNADHFSNGDEEVLGDVLKKLPGVEVEENGDIKVNGKSVGKVMVEGKDFFDGDTKLATKNIPADALEEIEVLRNHDDIAMMKGVRNNEDNIAINIRLKEGKKNFWFGDMTAGLGDPNRYTAQTKLFYYSPKYTLNFIGNLNNVGESAISFKDYMKFSGGFQSLLSGEGNSENLGDDPFFRLTHANQRVLNTNNHFGGLNYSYSPNKKTNFTGFLLYSKNNTTTKSKEDKAYSDLIPGVNSNEQTINSSENNDKLAMLKLKLDYKPNIKTQINYTLNGRFIEQNNETETNSSISNKINDDLWAKRNGFQQNLTWYQTINKKNIFSLAGSFSNERNESENKTIYEERNRFGFGDLFHIDTTESSLGINQLKHETTNRAELNLKYWSILGKNSQLEIGLGNSWRNQDFESDLEQNGSRLLSDDFVTTNHLTYRTWDRYAKFGYRWKNTKVNIQPALILHSYDFKISQFGNTTDFVNNQLLKSLSIKYKVNKNQNLNLSYNENIQLMALTKLAEGISFQSYNALFQGNTNLKPIKNDVYQLGYTNFNQFYNYSIYANVNYSLQENIISNKIENHANNQGGINQISTSENIYENQNNLSGTASFSKTKGKFIMKGQIQGTKTDYYQYLDNNLINNKSTTMSFEASIRSNFREYPNLELGYSESRQNYDQNGISTDYKTIKPFIKLKYNFKKNWMLTSEYTFNDFSTEGRNINTYSGLNASIRYKKKDNPWSFSVNFTNILNNNEINTNYASSLLISNTTHYVLPRFAWFQVTYKL